MNPQQNTPPQNDLQGSIYAPPQPQRPVLQPPKKEPKISILVFSVFGVSIILLILVLVFVILPSRATGFTHPKAQNVKLGNTALQVLVPTHYEEVPSDDGTLNILWSDPKTDGYMQVKSSEEIITSDEMLTLVEGVANNANGLRSTLQEGYKVISLNYVTTLVLCRLKV